MDRQELARDVLTHMVRWCHCKTQAGQAHWQHDSTYGGKTEQEWLREATDIEGYMMDLLKEERV